MSVSSTHTDALTRQIREGVAIINNQQDILLNSKQEFLQGAVPVLGHSEDLADSPQFYYIIADEQQVFF